MSKHLRVLAAGLIGGILAVSSGCSVESNAPTSTGRSTSLTSQLLPTLTGAGGTESASTSEPFPDGTYSFSVDPRIDQVLTLGKSRVVLPAGSVCALGVSGYGPTMWDKGCDPQKTPFTVTVTVAGSGTQHAAFDFQPSMRFNPLKRVTMDFHVPDLSLTSSLKWSILYCPTPNGQPDLRLGTSLLGVDPSCIDESLLDLSLVVLPNYQRSVLTRRLKHFSAYQVDRSGYTVAE